jgi:hypothetical protein
MMLFENIGTWLFNMPACCLDTLDMNAACFSYALPQINGNVAQEMF